MSSGRDNHVIVVSRRKNVIGIMREPRNGDMYSETNTEAWATPNRSLIHESSKFDNSDAQNVRNQQRQAPYAFQSTITDSGISLKDDYKLLNNSETGTSQMKNNGVNKWKIFVVIFGSFIGLCSLSALAMGIYLVVRPNGTSNSATNSSLGLRWYTTGQVVAGLAGTYGSSPDRFYVPIALTLDAFGAMYVSDNNNHRVQKWIVGAATGTTVAGQPGGTVGNTAIHLNKPYGLVVDSNGNIYIADSGNHRVQLWTNGSTSGTTVAGVTGSPGAGLNQLNTPYGVALDPTTGTLYVADTVNARIMSYTSGATSGTIVAGSDGYGILTTQLASPTGLYFDTTSMSLLVANEAANNIVRVVPGVIGWKLVAGSAAGTPGATPTLLSSPYGLTMDSMGNLYVADAGNYRIQFFLSGYANGTTIAGVAGVPGGNDQLFYAPYGVALDSRLNLYVSDTSNERVIMFQRY